MRGKVPTAQQMPSKLRKSKKNTQLHCSLCIFLLVFKFKLVVVAAIPVVVTPKHRCGVDLESGVACDTNGEETTNQHTDDSCPTQNITQSVS